MTDCMTIARPYAKAAFAIAKQHDCVAAWGDNWAALSLCVSILVQKKLISDPRLDAAALIAICEACVPAADTRFKQLIALLVAHKRLPAVVAMERLFAQAKIDDEGVCTVKVESAHPLQEAYLKRLGTQLKSRIKREVNCQNETNPQLLGGVRIHIGDLVVDASLRGRLDQLHQQMKQAPVPNAVEPNSRGRQ